MPLPIASKAPNFTLPSTPSGTFTLSETVKGKACIVFFYPKDFTRGCTAEVCDFRDNFGQLKGLDLNIVGISRDTIESHNEFKAMHNLPFELLSDPEGEVCKRYDALVPIIGMVKRITYLLDEHHTIVAVCDSFFEAREHVQMMIRNAKKVDSNT